MRLLLDPDRGGRLVEFSDPVVGRNLLGTQGGVERVFAPGTQVAAFARAKAKDPSDFQTGRYQTRLTKGKGALQARLNRQGWIRLNGVRRPVQVDKEVALSPRGKKVLFTHRLHNGSKNRLSFLFGYELVLNLRMRT